MSIVYAESSAVLRWLLGASGADRIEQGLASASTVVTSELTTAEVGRSLQRLVATGDIDPPAGERAWTSYSVASRHWHLYAVAEPILARVRQAFPREPLRTLDAIHLATALLHATELRVRATIDRFALDCCLELSPPTVLSVDQQVRADAHALGLSIAP